MAVDLILSSGFLAFARHAGFLAAVEDQRLDVDAIVGTSAGALAGALWAAGHNARDTLQILTEKKPLDWLRWHPRPWKGLWALDRFADGLRAHMPATFEELERPLALGVVALDGTHQLIRSGPLPEAVCASCAIPYIFTAVEHGGTLWRDGAGADRIGIEAWRGWRPEREAILHLIQRTRGVRTPFEPGSNKVIRSAASGAQLWNLGDVQARFDATYAAVLQELQATSA